MKATPVHIHPGSFVGQKMLMPINVGMQRIQRTRRVLLFLPLVGLAWQGVLAQSATDWVSAFLAASGAFLVLFDAFRPHRIFHYPLSTLIVIGFGVTLQIGPLLFTAFEGNSLTYNLEVPVYTFGYSVLASLVAITAHWIYRNSKMLSLVREKFRISLVRLQIFEALDLKDVLVMGGLGVGAFAIAPLYAGSLEDDNIIIKFIEGFRFLATIPAAYLLQTLRSESYLNNVSFPLLRKRLAWLFFLFYLLALIATGLIRNSRSTFILPVSCFVLGYALYFLFGLIRIYRSSLLAIALATLVGLPFLTDLASAMVMTRNLRDDISPFALAEQTLQQMEDRPAIEQFRKQATETGLISDWSEAYVDNIFLSRFANAKFPDNSLVNQSSLSSAGRAEMFLFHWHRFISILPSPVLRQIGVSDQIKAEANSISYGDKLYFLASGKRYALGGLRTGHFFGTGLAAFGAFFLFLLCVGFLLVFPLVDSHALISSGLNAGAPVISPIAITQLFGWFVLSNSESVVNLLSYPFRSFLEPILLFAFWRLFLRPLSLI